MRTHPRAISAALDLARAPTLAGVMRAQPVPPEVLEVIQVAARCQETIAKVSRDMNVSSRSVLSASEAYLQQVMMHPGASSHRILCVELDTPRAEVRKNLKWLLMWLHPERGDAGWRKALGRRVIAAWRDINSGSSPVRSEPTVRSRPVQLAYRPPWVSHPIQRSSRTRFVLICSGLTAVLLVSGLTALSKDLRVWVLNSFPILQVLSSI